MEEDEDVVFEGSAIHQHLMSTGYSDYELMQPVPKQHKDDDDRVGKWKISWPSLKKYIVEGFTFLFWSKELRKSLYRRALKNAYNTKILIADDQLLLKHFIPDGYAFSDGDFDASVMIQVILWCVQGLLLSIVLSVGAFTMIGHPSSLSTYMLTTLFTFIVWIVTVSWILLKSCYVIQNFVDALQSATRLFTKSLQLLLEEDLVSRGFVLVQGSSSFQSRHGLEAPHCQGLRLALHSTLYAMLTILRNWHLHLSGLVSYYPYMKCLFDDFEEITQEQKDDISQHLKFLKKLVTLVKLQMSSVTTELLLCAEKVDVFEHILNTGSITASSDVDQIKNDLILLQKHLNYAQSFWQIHSNTQPESICEAKKNDVYLAIHSLSLHIQAALSKIYDLEAKFDIELCHEQNQQNLDALPSHEFVRNKLNSIQSELQSCQGCFEETLVRVDRRYSIQEEPVITITSTEKISEEIMENKVSKKPPIPLFELDKPVVKDEVFEAYVDDEYFDNKDKESNDDFWNSDLKKERKRVKQQREQGKRVLHELQPLLNKLREEWEERETAALHRQRTEIAQALYGNDPKWLSNESDAEISNTNETPLDKATNLEDFKEGKFFANTKDIFQTMPLAEYKNSDDQRLNKDREVRMEFEKSIDSDDERLNKYRRVRKELEMHGKSSSSSPDEEKDSDDERLENYWRVKKQLEMEENYSVTDSGAEADSDEERVEVYRRIKKQLDREQNRIINPVGQSSENLSPPRMTKVDTMPMHTVCGSENEAEYNFQPNPPRLQSFSDMSDFKFSANLNDIQSALSKGNLFDTKTKPELHSDSKQDDTSSLQTKILHEETFACGDDSDEDTSAKIDWNAVTLPTRLSETLEDRMQLFCGGQNRGFHADIAAQAQAASRQFLLNKEDSSVQTFRGVGENEDIFGDESE